MLTFFFFSTSPPPLDIYTLSLHDALPILRAWPAESDDASVPTRVRRWTRRHDGGLEGVRRGLSGGHDAGADARQCADRKSTRLNSSHMSISYAVFCLKKKIKLI